MTSFMALDGVTSFLRLKDVTITCKRMRRSRRIGGSSTVQWRKVGRSWRLGMCVRRILCVRIEIDQLLCVNCWVIIHCLSVSCTKIYHSRCALVIWSSLQLTSKQWIITQQFTAGADLFLNLTNYITGDATDISKALLTIQMDGETKKIKYGLRTNVLILLSDGLLYYMSQCMRFPIMCHLDKCRLRRACAASF